MNEGVYRDRPAVAAPDVLIISGLDPSGGAGFLADARVVHALGARPVGVVSALTVQSTRGMRSAHAVDRDVLREQLVELLTDIEVHAVKIGMLASGDVIRVLDEALGHTGAPVVWDPIAGPTRGEGAIAPTVLTDALRTLAPHLALITPNTRELGVLTGAAVSSLVECVTAAKQLAATSGVAVLVKGGHVETLAAAHRAERVGAALETTGVPEDGALPEDGRESIDALCTPDGTVEYLRGPWIAGADVHGTGCALSSAIAAHLALGQPLLAACRAAKAYVATLIANPVSPGQGAPSVV